MVTTTERRLVEVLDTAREQTAQFAQLVDDPESYRAGLADLTELLEEELPDVVAETTAQWVGYLRHELAQAMAVLTGVVETLVVHGEDLDEDTRDELYERAQRQVLLMQRVLEQLDRARRLEAETFEVEPEPVDLAAAIRATIEDHEPVLADAAVEVDVGDGDGPLHACVEPAALAEVLIALLSNAVEHAPCDEPLLVEARPRDGTVRISVHDDGPGVAEQDRERIFERGERLDEGRGGLGLGLFVARSLADAHGGSLTVTESERRGGARFDLVLPSGC